MATRSLPLGRTRLAARLTAGRESYQRQWLILLLLMLSVDALAAWISLTLAFSLRFTSGILAYSSTYDPQAYHRFALFSVPIWLLTFWGVKLYHRDILLGGVEEYKRIATASVLGVVIIIVASFFWRQTVPLSRGYILLALSLSIGILIIERFTLRRIGYSLRRRGWLTERALIVGASDQGSAIATQWLSNPTSGMEVIGFVDDFKPVGSPVVGDLKVLGRPSAIADIVHETGAREVVVISGAVAWETFEELIGHAAQRNGFTIRLSPGFYELVASGVGVTSKSFVPLLTLDANRLVGLDAVLKNVFDYGLGIVGALLVSPLLLMIAAEQLLHDGKITLTATPALGRQADLFSLHRFTAPRHPGLARLPELFDVLTGKMSLVGPRPRLATEPPVDPLVGYNLQSVKPGMVGPWLLTGQTDSDEALREELHYIRNWTIWLDVQLITQVGLRLLRDGRNRLRNYVN